MNFSFKRITNLTWTTVLFSAITMAQGPATEASPLPRCEPEEAGLSAERLQRIDDLIDRHIEEDHIAGAVTMVARKGQLAWYETHGWMDRESGRPMEADAIFQMASMTKPITMTAIMMLYEEGHFLLHDPISKYIPEFKDPMVVELDRETDSLRLVPAKSEITIRSVINFTCGIGRNQLTRRYYQEAGMDGSSTSRTGILEDRIKALAKAPLICHPGEEFNYGVATDVLGYLVEVISGMKFNDFLRERIFSPLKMHDTFFILPPEKADRLAKMYGTNPDGTIRPSDRGTDHLINRTYFSAGAGLMSTAPDYIRFAQMILNEGELDGVRLLSRKSVEMMRSNSIGDLYSGYPHDSGDKFGLGFGIRTERGRNDELESLGTFGWNGAYYTTFFIDPSEELIGMFLSQAGGAWNKDHELAIKFRVMVFQSISD